jgi:hypothetical protein
MSPERSLAYRRVMKTLNDLGASKLQPTEQEQIREAADTLIFSVDPDNQAPACAALEDLEKLMDALVECGRWQRETAERLVGDVYACGPANELELSAA